MLHDDKSLGVRQGAESDNSAPDGEFVDVDRLFAVLRRQWRVVAICCMIGVLLGIAYVTTAVPLYTASSNLLIDKGSNRIVDALSSSTDTLADDTTILSQVELLKSDKIGLAVVDKLKLYDDPVLMTPPTSLIQSARGALRSVFDVSSWFGGAQEENDNLQEERRLQANAILKSNVEVTRIGRTSVLSIAYTSPSNTLSANVAKAFAEAYLVDQFDSKYEATRRASVWLQERIEELRQRSLQSDRAVQQFRADNGLIVTDGRLVTDQQLSELNTQLVSAQAAVSQAKARYDRIESLVESGDTNAVVSDSLGSTVVNSLRTKYLDAAKREADLSNRLGPNHQQAVRLRGEMSEYRRLMFGELARLAESYKSDLEVAQIRESSLRASVEAATGVTAGANQLQVQLRELEREADTFRNLYQTFLQRYQEAIQQQSFPVTEARVITEAQPPMSPSKPRKLLVLALAGILGAAAGGALAAVREFRDRFFRTGDQVREDLGLEPLGLVPRVDSVASPRPAPAELDALADQRLLLKSNNVGNYVIDHPMSSFAETLRSAKIAADLTVEQKRGRVIGVISTLPGEGKSTISANLAELLALQGARTLLIDGDLRNPGLTRNMASHAKSGLVEAILEDHSLAETIFTNPQTGLDMVPTVLRHRIPHTSELLSSHAMASLVEEAARSYDYVVIDLPPIAPVVDVRAFASRVDAFIYVVEWGHTARRVVRSALRAHPRIEEKCLGVILNKVDSAKMRLYQDFGSSEYYSSRYTSYYHEKS